MARKSFEDLLPDDLRPWWLEVVANPRYTITERCQMLTTKLEERGEKGPSRAAVGAATKKRQAVLDRISLARSMLPDPKLEDTADSQLARGIVMVGQSLVMDQLARLAQGDEVDGGALREAAATIRDFAQVSKLSTDNQLRIRKEIAASVEKHAEKRGLPGDLVQELRRAIMGD